jgi:hypothetical protein
LGDADLRDLSFDPGPPRDDRNPDRKTWRDWTDAWLAGVPQGPARGGAASRLVVLTEVLDQAGEAALRATWPDPVPEAPPDPVRVAARLADIGCAGEHAPHVARSVLWSIDGRGLGSAAGPLLDRFADAERCPGARGLSDAERAGLAARRDGVR